MEIKDIIAVAAEARGAWLKKHANPQLIKDKVSTLLDNAFLSIVFKHLDVSEVNRGYYGNSVTRFIREAIDKSIQEWVDSNRNKELFTLTEETIKEIQNLYNKCYMEKIREAVEEHAKQQAKDKVQEILLNEIP